jgi:hypothetical protein
MIVTMQSAVSTFGEKAKAKLANLGASGEPEDQLRAPFERLLADFASLLNFPDSAVAAVGESAIRDLKIRPDYAVTAHGILIGFVELKAPGKGADPRRFRDPHDKAQWEKLKALPNLMYTDGNAFSLWQDGELVGSVVLLIGDIETAGKDLAAPSGLQSLFESFLHWEPIPPRTAKELARVSARLCRLLRDEVTEQMAHGSEALTALAVDWRKMLFPDATDEKFAEGYSQAVTFGLLMARAKGIDLSAGLLSVAQELTLSSSLIGSALKILTDSVENQAALKTSLGMLVRVLNAVDWQTVSKGKPEAWLYFYEDFLEIYDNELRKQSGSYYTPPEVVSAMVNMVDEVLRSPRFGLSVGLASPSVTLIDPAMGTGTFLLGVLNKVAETVKEDEGEGAVRGAINAAVKRLIAFEIQLGPFAVAQLRILAELVDLVGSVPKTPARLFVTDTLANPSDDEGWIPGILAPIAQSRKDANKVKRNEPITVVLGNPPYKEKAKGLGGWVEGESKTAEITSPLATWMPPKDWKLGAHSKHLRNLYVFFWRWATWKVFDHGPGEKKGIVCFITVAGFLNGPGFQKMRDYLRRTCDDIWIIDCSPEGHQPEVNTRVFQGVQQPICIVMASRSPNNNTDVPAKVKFRVLPEGHRNIKFEALQKMTLSDRGWTKCSSKWRAPFRPASSGDWASFPSIDTIFVYDGSGTMPGRTWIIAPDSESLLQRWRILVATEGEQKELLFHPHLNRGKLGDRHTKKIIKDALGTRTPRLLSVANDTGDCVAPTRYGFRSFDRQWIIPDKRLINRPNDTLWRIASESQLFLTALSRESPTAGPSITCSALVPDLHHYKGSFGGRVFPLWLDADASQSNVRPAFINFLVQKYDAHIKTEDIVAYIMAVAAHSAFIARFRQDLSTPGLRIPITTDKRVFSEVAELGRNVIWLHTFGDRMVDPKKGRPFGPPRLPPAKRPTIPANGAISQDPGEMPDEITYDPKTKRLFVGQGYVCNVEPEVWYYEVSGTQVLLHWFSYRKANRERPVMGDRRPPSPLSFIQPDHWFAEYTTELLNVINVLGLLVDLEPIQAKLLDKVCDGPTFSVDELQAAGAFELPPEPKKKGKKPNYPGLFDVLDPKT